MFARSVFTLARRMLASRALAEDALQDTFIEVIASFESGEPLKITVMREQRRQTLDIVIPAERNG